MSVDVGGSGRLYGAGGDGGKGADSWSDGGSTNGGSGGNGTSALGIEHEETAVNIQSGGRIRCGFGGGGGGAGARQVCLLYTSPSPRDYAASRMPSSA